MMRMQEPQRTQRDNRTSSLPTASRSGGEGSQFLSAVLFFLFLALVVIVLFGLFLGSGKLILLAIRWLFGSIIGQAGPVGRLWTFIDYASILGAVLVSLITLALFLVFFIKEFVSMTRRGPKNTPYQAILRDSRTQLLSTIALFMIFQTFLLAMLVTLSIANFLVSPNTIATSAISISAAFAIGIGYFAALIISIYGYWKDLTKKLFGEPDTQEEKIK